jgi:hypothetical protein
MSPIALSNHWVTDAGEVLPEVRNRQESGAPVR